MGTGTGSECDWHGTSAVIPVTIRYNGKETTAHLIQVKASAKPYHWMLTIQANFYAGAISQTPEGMQFRSHLPELQQQADYLIDVLIAWYE